MINPERFSCAFYGAKDKVLEILKICLQLISKRENLDQFLENLFEGMNSSDNECQFGLLGRTSCC